MRGKNNLFGYVGKLLRKLMNSLLTLMQSSSHSATQLDMLFCIWLIFCEGQTQRFLNVPVLSQNCWLTEDNYKQMCFPVFSVFFRFFLNGKHLNFWESSTNVWCCLYNINICWFIVLWSNLCFTFIWILLVGLMKMASILDAIFLLVKYDYPTYDIDFYLILKK